MIEPVGSAALIWVRLKLPVGDQPFVAGECAGQM